MKNKFLVLMCFVFVSMFFVRPIFANPLVALPPLISLIFSMFNFALILALIIETLIALAYLFKRKISKKVLISVFIGNLISVPLLWFCFNKFQQLIAISDFLELSTLIILVGEIFVFIFEALFVYFLNKKRIKLGESFILSAIMNLISFICGLIILPLIF